MVNAGLEIVTTCLDSIASKLSILRRGQGDLGFHPSYVEDDIMQACLSVVYSAGCTEHGL
jgi:hypothetical protein